MFPFPIFFSSDFIITIIINIFLMRSIHFSKGYPSTNSLSTNFKLITHYIVRSLNIFNHFYIVSWTVLSFLFFIQSFFPFASLSPSRSVSLLLRCTNIIKLSRLYYSTTVHFYFPFLPLCWPQSICFHIFTFLLLIPPS